MRFIYLIILYFDYVLRNYRTQIYKIIFDLEKIYI